MTLGEAISTPITTSDIFTFKIKVEDGITNVFSSFTKLFSRYGDLKPFIRDIRLAALLDKASLYELDEIDQGTRPIYGYLGIQEDNNYNIELSKVCFTVSRISIKMKDENNIYDIEIGIRFLQTPIGKEAQSLLDSNIELELKIHFSRFQEYLESPFFWRLEYFYLNIPN